MFYALQSEDEREMCTRTIYCTNIDKKVVSHVHYFSWMPVWSTTRAIIPGLFVQLMQVTQADVKLFFESVCGEVCSFSCDLPYKCCLSYICHIWWFLTEHFCFKEGSTLEAVGRLSSFNSYCFCWVHNGSYSVPIFIYWNCCNICFYGIRLKLPILFFL